MAEVYMVGTDHFDRNGPEKLGQVLTNVRPDLILIEGARNFFDAMERASRETEIILKKGGMPDWFITRYLAATKTSGYELFVSRDYVSCETDASLDYLNDSGTNYSEFWEYLQQKLRDLKRSLPGFKRDPSGEIARIESETDGLLDAGAQSLSDVAKYVLPKFGTAGEEREARLVMGGFDVPDSAWERDKIMETTLRKACEQSEAESVILTVTGLTHLIRTRLNLTFYSRVRDLNPKRIFLLDPVVYEGESV